MNIGDLSSLIGEDVREVWMAGYSDEQIDRVAAGKCTLEDLYKMPPDGNNRTPYGKEILARRERPDDPPASS